MSDESKVPSGEPEVSAGGTNQESSSVNEDLNGASGSKKDSVAYETYRKTFNQLKQRDERLAQVEQEKDELLKEKLQAEGKKDELIEHYKKKAEENEERYKKLHANTAYEKVTHSVRELALKSGCRDVDALIHLYGVDGLDIGENLKPTSESIDLFLEKARKERGWLFETKAPEFKDAKPKDGVPASSGSNEDYFKELRAAKTQNEFDAVRKKYGRV